jgi:hypothetical protein
MYTAMRSSSFFGRDIPVIQDVLADNVYISSSNSGRYLAYQNYNYIASTAEPGNIWNQGYVAILQANRIIYAANSLPQTNAVKQLRGEAFIARALCYLELVNFFGSPYTVNPAADGVPFVTTPTFLTGPYSKPSRSSVTTVYAKITSDLDSAYNTMPALTASTFTLHPLNSEFLARYAAKAIESRAYLYKGEYANARDAALLVVNNAGYTLADSSAYVSYWANPTAQTGKVETIFELALTSTSNNGTNGLDNFYYQPNAYGDGLVYGDLYNQYNARDVRKQLILTSSPTRGAVFVINKYSNLPNGSDKDDIKVIRYSEVLLTLAESYARLGDDVNAQLYVNQVAKKRQPTFTGYLTTGATLASDIVAERRKELAFEGLRYFDLTRLNLPVSRPAQTGIVTTVRTLDVTSTKRIFPVPQAEIDANPAVKQNTGY